MRPSSSSSSPSSSFMVRTAVAQVTAEHPHFGVRQVHWEVLARLRSERSQVDEAQVRRILRATTNLFDRVAPPLPAPKQQHAGRRSLNGTHARPAARLHNDENSEVPVLVSSFEDSDEVEDEDDNPVAGMPSPISTVPGDVSSSYILHASLSSEPSSSFLVPHPPPPKVRRTGTRTHTRTTQNAKVHQPHASNDDEDDDSRTCSLCPIC